jgi:hypothetical protein
VLQLIARTTGWLNIYVGCRALGLPYGIETAALLYATLNVAEYVIALMPARVGVSEGTAFFVFKYFGLNAPMGLVLSTFLRVRNIALSFLIAPFAFVGRPGRGGTPAESAAADGTEATVQLQAEAEPESRIDRASAP